MSTPIEKIDVNNLEITAYNNEVDVAVGILAEKINELVDVVNEKQDKPCSHESIEVITVNAMPYPTCTKCRQIIFNQNA